MAAVHSCGRRAAFPRNTWWPGSRNTLNVGGGWKRRGWTEYGMDMLEEDHVLSFHLTPECWGCCWKNGYEKFCLVLVSILISLFFLIMPMSGSPCSFASQCCLLFFVAFLHKSEVLYVTRLLLLPPGTQVNQLQLIFVMLWISKNWVQLRENLLQTGDQKLEQSCGDLWDIACCIQVFLYSSCLMKSEKRFYWFVWLQFFKKTL